MKFIKTVFSAILLAVALSSAAIAQNIEVRKVDKHVYSAFLGMSKAQARRQLSGYTLLAKARRLGSPSTRKLIPFSGVSVMYFRPNGQLLVWSGKSSKVEAGRWKVIKPGRYNMVCFSFPSSLGHAVCTQPFGQIFGESTKGNPFKLRANAPVPYKLGRFGVSLKGIAKRLN